MMCLCDCAYVYGLSIVMPTRKMSDRLQLLYNIDWPQYKAVTLKRAMLSNKKQPFFFLNTAQVQNAHLSSCSPCPMVTLYAHEHCYSCSMSLPPPFKSTVPWEKRVCYGSLFPPQNNKLER